MPDGLKFGLNARVPTALLIEVLLIAFAVAFGANGGILAKSLNGNVVMLFGKVVAWSNPNACGPWFAG